MKMKFFAILTLIFLVSCSAPKKDDIDKKVDNLLIQMTLEEKIGQLCCPIGFNLDDESYHRLMDTLPCGGFWAVLRADPWSQKTVETGPDARESALIFNKMQRYAVENTRLGIPIYFAEECPHGLMAVGANVYPTGLGLAATWYEDLLHKVGDNIGEEAANRGAKYAFGPVLDIARDPRWSRVEEGFGEDPYLSGALGSAVIRGMQNHLAATVKHFAAYGIPEGGHNGAAAQTGPHYLVSDYLANFEMAVKNGAKSIMTSYNAIDGTPCSSNSYLLKDVLRKQWGIIVDPGNQASYDFEDFNKDKPVLCSPESSGNWADVLKNDEMAKRFGELVADILMEKLRNPYSKAMPSIGDACARYRNDSDKNAVQKDENEFSAEQPQDPVQ